MFTIEPRSYQFINYQSNMRRRELNAIFHGKLCYWSHLLQHRVLLLGGQAQVPLLAGAELGGLLVELLLALLDLTDQSEARSSIRSRSSSMVLISLPNSLRLPAITSSSSVWLEPMQSNLKLIRWLARLLWALDKFLAVLIRFFTSLISSLMLWLVLSNSFSWLCKLSLKEWMIDAMLKSRTII